MKPKSNCEKPDCFRQIPKRIATLCLSLLMVLILSGAVFSDSPVFFAVSTNGSLDQANESSEWLTPSSCSGTCFHNPVRLTSSVAPVTSAQNHFGQFAVAYGPTAEPERSPAVSTDRRVAEPARGATLPPASQANSAQNRFRQFTAASNPAAERQVAAPARQAPVSRPVPQVNSAQDYLGQFYGTPQVNLEAPPQVAVASQVPYRRAPQRSIHNSDSAQTPFSQAAFGYQTTVRLVQNVDELQPVDATRSQEQNAAGGESVSEEESLGRAPESTGIQFLRTQTVLLKPCQWQFDAGLSYTIAEADFPVQVGNPITGVTEGRIRQRLLVVPFEARYGLTSRIQLFGSAPVGYSNTEFAAGNIDTYTDTGGIGDVSFGLSAQLIPGSACRPELIGTFAVTAPTGDAALYNTLLSPEAALGEGFWGFTANLLWVRTYDPVILFYGVGANFRLDAEIDGIDVDPGERFLYQFGVGFAVNRHVTLSTAFLGSYWVEDRWNGVRLPGGIREPLRLRFAATVGKSCRIVEPFAEIGMTDDAPSSRIGITWTF